MTTALDRAKRDLLYAALTVIVESDNDEAKRKGLDSSALLHKPRLRLHANQTVYCTCRTQMVSVRAE